MKTNIRRITETAVMLALLICLQWAGSLIPAPMAKQIVTGSFVNCVLAVTVLLVGLWGGVSVALISPVFAYGLNIAPNLITVLPIMLGNLCFVLLLHFLLGKSLKPVWKQPLAVVVAAAVKFGVLYGLVVEVICGSASGLFLGKKVGDAILLAPKMLTMLPSMFTWPQLITALTGGFLAIFILPVLKKALHK